MPYIYPFQLQFLLHNNIQHNMFYQEPDFFIISECFMFTLFNSNSSFICTINTPISNKRMPYVPYFQLLLLVIINFKVICSTSVPIVDNKRYTLYSYFSTPIPSSNSIRHLTFRQCAHLYQSLIISGYVRPFQFQFLHHNIHTIRHTIYITTNFFVIPRKKEHDDKMRDGHEL